MKRRIIALLLGIIFALGTLPGCVQGEKPPVDPPDNPVDPIVYTVVFNTGGVKDIPQQRIETGKKVNEPGDPEKTGFDFGGWYKDAGCQDAWDFSADTVTGNITLYAKWTPVTVVPGTFDVTFVTNCGLTVPQQSLTEGEAASEPSGIERDYYTFGGWFSDKAFKSVYNFSSPVTRAITLYAKWTPINYTVTYFNVTEAEKQVNAGNRVFNADSYEMILEYPVRAGYILTGWFENSSFTGEPVLTIPAGSHGDKNLYAQWALQAGLSYRRLSGAGHPAYEVYLCTSYASEIRILPYYNGAPVENICAEVFKNFYTLQTIIIPHTVKTIGMSAFQFCDSLSNVIFEGESRLSGMAGNVFYGCTSLYSINLPKSLTYMNSGCFNNTGIYSIVPEGSGVYVGDWMVVAKQLARNSAFQVAPGTKHIASKAFNASSVAEIAFPHGIVSIGDNLFGAMGGFNLSYVFFPDTLERIGDAAFQYCRALNGFTIPASVKYIGGSAFQYTGRYDSAPANSIVCLDNWVVGAKGYLGETVTVAPGTKGVGSSAFVNNRTFKNLILPDSLKYLGSSILYLTDAETVTFGGNSQLTDIPYSAFWHSDRLRSIGIPNSVTSIGDFAFSECPYLSGITIPKSVKSVGIGVFEDNSALTQIDFEQDSELKHIGAQFALNCTALENIAIPDNVETMGNYAFSNCAALSSVAFSAASRFKTAGYCVFSGDVGLETVALPDSLEEISDGMFLECSFLKEITIPKNVRIIKNDAFNGCSSLESVTFSADGIVSAIGSRAFRQCVSMETLEIPSGVSGLGVQVFSSWQAGQTVKFLDKTAAPAGFNAGWNDLAAAQFVFA